MLHTQLETNGTFTAGTIQFEHTQWYLLFPRKHVFEGLNLAMRTAKTAPVSNFYLVQPASEPCLLPRAAAKSSEKLSDVHANQLCLR